MLANKFRAFTIKSYAWDFIWETFEYKRTQFTFLSDQTKKLWGCYSLIFLSPFFSKVCHYFFAGWVNSKFIVDEKIVGSIHKLTLQFILRRFSGYFFL